MIPIEASDAETSVVADSTDSEMLPDEEYREPEQKGRKDRKRKEPAAPEDMTGYMFEINMTGTGSSLLANHGNRQLGCAVTKEKATAQEVSAIRGALGTLSWRANQVNPQFLADVGLMLSEVPTATVDLILRINKVIREAKRMADQTLIFHPFDEGWEDLCVVTWSDAAQNNRVNRGSTIGMLTCIAPKRILDGERVPM
eukprot:s7534_g1.t1